MGVSAMYEGDAVNVEQYTAWADAYAAQVILLASGVRWSTEVDAALALRKSQPTALSGPIARVLSVLSALASKVMLPLSPERRSKYEQLITELVHERDVTRSLDKHGITDANDFEWLSQLRYCWTGGSTALGVPATGRVTRAASAAAATAEASLRVCLANASFPYGFEYLGVGERLVQTSLTDRCYLTLTQALHLRLGGNPFGPAGTGKTESVKALGSQLGRFVLVFNCDEHFDFKAMGRIFVGLCQVGAWGCFDEFNRLEERILSAVSSQILAIQTALLRDVSTRVPPWLLVWLLDVFGQAPLFVFFRCRGAGANCGVDWEDSQFEQERGRVCDDESWVRWTLQFTRQPEAAVPLRGHDQAGLGAHRASHVVLARLPDRGKAGWPSGCLV
jgi:dynein heavy chain 1, cytosolic